MVGVKKPDVCRARLSGLQFSLFTHADFISPVPCKKYDLQGGEIHQDQQRSGALVSSNVARVELSDLKEFAKRMESFGHYHHLTAGVSQHKNAHALPVSQVRGQTVHHVSKRPIITRTNAALPFPNGQGLMTIDADSVEGDPHPMLVDACAGLDSYARVLTTSSSSNIYDLEGNQLKGIGGVHVFYHVKNAQDIPRALTVLHKRLIIKGHGKARITKNGNILIRSAVDTALKVSSQPIYIKAEVGEGLEQRKLIQYFPGAEVLDTHTVIPDLSPEEDAAFARVKSDLEQEASPRALETKKVYVADRVAEHMKYGMTEGDAIATVSSALEGGMLEAGFILYTVKGPVTVKEVLRDPKTWHGVGCRDPLEPDYGSATVAKIYSDQERPTINSFAHSEGNKGRTFYLRDVGLMFAGLPASNLADDVIANDALTTTPSFSLNDFALNGTSKEMEAKMLEDKFILGRMALLGQSTAFYAKPNAGKTLLALYMLIEAIKSGEIDGDDVFYINADDNHKGLTQKLKLAEEYGFRMLAPGYNNFKAESLSDYLNKLIDSGDARGKVLILDTLKKFTDIMAKGKASGFGEYIRQFVSHGGSVIMLAHVNKHKDEEGKVVFSGTADIVDDADCCYRLDLVTKGGASNIRTVEFENFKCRGDVAMTSIYEYDAGEGLDYRARLESVRAIDDEEAGQRKRMLLRVDRYQEDKRMVDVIRQHISEGCNNKTALINTVRDALAEPRRNVLRVLHDYAGTDVGAYKFWHTQKGDKNATVYILNDEFKEQ